MMVRIRDPLFYNCLTACRFILVLRRSSVYLGALCPEWFLTRFAIPPYLFHPSLLSSLSPSLLSLFCLSPSLLSLLSLLAIFYMKAVKQDFEDKQAQLNARHTVRGKDDDYERT